jgi:hypothetical protein
LFKQTLEETLQPTVDLEELEHQLHLLLRNMVELEAERAEESQLLRLLLLEVVEEDQMFLDMLVGPTEFRLQAEHQIPLLLLEFLQLDLRVAEETQWLQQMEAMEAMEDFPLLEEEAVEQLQLEHNLDLVDLVLMVLR